MDYLKNNKISLFLIYINMLFIFKVFAFCYKIQNFGYLLSTGVFVVVLLLYIFFHSVLKSNIQRFATFILLFLILTVIIVLKKQDFYLYLGKVFGNISLANDLMYKGEDIGFYLMQQIFCVLTGIILIFLLILCNKGFTNTIVFINLICMLLLWYTGYSDEIKNNIFGFIFISTLTYCFNSYVRALRKDMKDGLKCNIKKSEIAFSIFISCFMIALFQIILPQQFNGKFSSNTKSFFQNNFVKSGIDDSTLGQKLKFSLSTSGYEDSDKKLGGPVNIDNEIALKVKSDKQYYLRGITKDKYDGFTWKKTFMDYQTKLANTNIYDEKQFYNNNTKETLIVYPQKIKTSTMFAPLYTYNCILGKSKAYYNIEDKTLIKENDKPEKYDVDFYKINKEIDILDDNNYKLYNTLENYQQYDVTEKYGAYLDVPGNVSLEVIHLVQQITAGSVNSAEKVFKIKNYLKQNYRYSLDVSDVPKDKEFVSYFLFDEKKGYCTYFATAATIMCRIAGVPARYVEGFNMENIQDNDGLYIVTNEDAHAWTEVMLMPDTGLWTTMDCVPNAASLIHQEDSNTPGGKSSNTKLQEEQRTKKNKSNETKTKTNVTNSKKQSFNKFYILYLILILISTFIIARILIFILKKKKILKSLSVIPLYCYSVKRLDRVGIKIPNDKSDKEYFSTYDDPILKQNMKSILELSYEEYYGNRKYKDFNKKDYYCFIEKYIRKRENIIKYVIKKYFYNY